MCAIASPWSNPVLTNWHHCEPQEIPGPQQHGRMFPDGGVPCAPGNTLSLSHHHMLGYVASLCHLGQLIVNGLRGMPIKSQTYVKTHENNVLWHLMRFVLFFKRSEGFVRRGHALRGAQDCRASWGPCVAWESLGPCSAWGSLTCQP